MVVANVTSSTVVNRELSSRSPVVWGAHQRRFSHPFRRQRCIDSVVIFVDAGIVSQPKKRRGLPHTSISRGSAKGE